MKRLHVFICFAVFFPVFALADTIVLKNGMRFDSERVWEENGEIKGMVRGVIVGFPKNDVDHVEKTEKRTEHIINKIKDDKARQGSEQITKTTQNRLEQMRNELENEYKALLEELDGLSKGKPDKTNREQLRIYGEAVLQYNKKVAEYENKREAYIAAVERYRKRINKKFADGKADKDRFEKMFASWIGRTITDFIGEWGNPDDISDALNHRRVYRFVVEIAPSNTRSIYFTTDPSGKIVDYRSGETKKE